MQGKRAREEEEGGQLKKEDKGARSCRLLQVGFWWGEETKRSGGVGGCGRQHEPVAQFNDAAI